MTGRMHPGSPGNLPSPSTENDAPAGWTHEEAKNHSLIERLHERCATYAGMPCEYRIANKDDWCERCLAADVLASVTPPEEGQS